MKEKPKVCPYCKSASISWIDRDLYACRDCAETFELAWGLGFNEQLFCGYSLFGDYENFMRAHYFKQFLNLQKTNVFLDAGCGYGYFTLHAARTAKYAVGLDVQYWLVEKAERTRKRFGLENAMFKHGSLYRIPFADGYFDKVLCAEVLEHIVDPKRVLKELARVCSGVLVIQTPTLGVAKRLGEKLLGAEATDARRVETENTALDHVQHFSPQNLARLVCSCGFRIESVASVKIAPLNLLANNKAFITFEYLLDCFGRFFPFNQAGTMTILKCKKI